jgi:hypothetical protein
MKVTALRLFGVLLCLLPTLAAATTLQTLHRSDLPSGFTLLEARDDLLRFEVELGQLVAEEIATSSGDFTRLVIPGWHHSQEIGLPELPVMNKLIEIPLGAEIQVSVDATRTRTINLSTLGLAAPVHPVQPSLAKSADPSLQPFHFDGMAYQQDQSHGGDWVRVIEEGQMRAMRLGRVLVSPVRYNPTRGELVVAESIEFTLSFPGADRQAQRDLYAATYSPFFRPVYDGVLGGNSGERDDHSNHPDLQDGAVKYVIVYHSMFESQLASFVEWKTRKGFEVIMASTSDIGASASAIRSYLQGLYNAGTPSDPAPTFLLIVGDTAQVPYSLYSSGHASDLNYAEFTGDRIPEMYYGRFSATNASQLQAQIDKTIEYETYAMPDPSYLATVDLIAGVDSYYASSHGNGQIRYGEEHYFNAGNDISCNLYTYPGSGSADATIRADVSAGLSLINYTAHGDVTLWYDPNFTNSHVNSLTNYNKYCLAIGNCCLTNSFQSATCFGEAWLRAAGKGAIGYIGGSDVTYWNEDYWWGVGYHSAGQINGTAWPYGSTGLGAYDGLFHDHGESMDNWYMVNDAIIFCGNLAVVESGSSMRNYYWEIYHLMGDPSLATYIGVPDANSVSHDTALTPANSFCNVSAAPGSYVGICLDGELLGCGEVGIGGSAQIPVDLDGAFGSAEIVVTAQNRQPYFGSIEMGDLTATGSTPAAMSLAANYPNPFNPKTSIRFSLAKTGPAELQVFDAAGRLVRQLLSGTSAAGEHVVTWDGRDDAGAPMSSGLYFYRLSAEERNETRKMLLLK